MKVITRGCVIIRSVHHKYKFIKFYIKYICPFPVLRTSKPRYTELEHHNTGITSIRSRNKST